MGGKINLEIRAFEVKIWGKICHFFSHNVDFLATMGDNLSGDICRRNAGLCKQQPNLAPIQRERERVISRWKYHEDSQ